MQIRSATLEDIPALVELGRRLHALTRFRIYDYNASRVGEQLRALIENRRGSHCFFVAEDGTGIPAGALIGCVERHFFSDLPVASIVQLVVLPERRMGGAGLRLLSAFRKWAENRDAFEICAGVNSGTDIGRMDRFLKRLGFRLTGGNYSLRLGAADRNVPLSQPPIT